MTTISTKEPATTMSTARPGFTIRRNISRPIRSLVDALAEHASATLSDVQGRVTTMSSSISAVDPGLSRMAGPALTVKARPGDNLLTMKAIELAMPGDIIVIAGDGDRTLSLWGGIMSMMAKRRGIAGVVVDGLVRDAHQIRESGVPVFSIGLTPAAPTKLGPGRVNDTVSCGGVVVSPGDIVVADEDGVVVVPQRDARAILALAGARQAKDDAWIEAVNADDFSTLVESDDGLVAMGCQFLD